MGPSIVIYKSSAGRNQICRLLIIILSIVFIKFVAIFFLVIHKSIVIFFLFVNKINSKRKASESIFNKLNKTIKVQILLEVLVEQLISQTNNVLHSVDI